MSISKNKTEPIENGKVYLELWQVDTFEGGVGSRTTFLQGVCNKYAKSTGVNVLVKSQTALSCKQKFESGIYPDMISYGNGIDLPYERLWQLNCSSCDDLCGKYSKIWCSGGYLLISRMGKKFDGIIISTQENTVPLLAYHLSKESSPIFEEIDSKNAIYAFYQHSDKALLGTQRDLYRLQNKGIDLNVKPICEFNDLLQYISITTTDEKKVLYCQSFIDYLSSDEIVSSLHKIGMISLDKSGKNSFEYPLDVYNGVAWQYITEELLSQDGVKKLKEMAKNCGQNLESIKIALKRLK